MTNAYEYIIGGHVPDEAQTKVLASNLRGADDRAMLALLSGDDVLTGVGKQLNARTQARAGGLSKARQAHLQRNQQQTLQDERLAQQKGLSEQQMAQQKAWQEAQAAQWATQNKLAEDKYLESQQQWSDRLLQMEEDRKVKQSQYEATKNKAVKAEVRNLQGDLVKAGVPQMDSAFSGVDSVLKNYVDENGKVTKDIPGQGAGKFLPKSGMFIGDDGVKLRSNYASVKNQVLKARSGAAVTTPELERLDNELSQNTLASDQDFVDAYLNLKAQMAELERAVRAGYDPEVNQVYDAQLGVDTSSPTGGIDLETLNQNAGQVTVKTSLGTPVKITGGSQ